MNLQKLPAESVLFDIDCSSLLAANETITSAITMSFLPILTGGDALTFGTASTNQSAITYPDRVSRIGTVIQVRIGGGTSEVDKPKRVYSVLATFQTSVGNTIQVKVPLNVINPAPRAF